ncbi:FAD-dependent monooxygenase [Streptomyces sp. NPDC089919]|uniref:FAD-dependent monooxygenase n=1 Tax=Streptomyces sp. NPDC089919 TaxID=3155188 RepID=UPI00342F0100
MKTRVIVVGAGPVGLMLAGEIALGGGDVVVYDKEPAAHRESRALGFTKRVAEILDQRGLLTRLGEYRRGEKGHFGGIHVDLDFLDERHNGVLGLPQWRTQATLTEWLTELGVEIRWGHAAVDFTEDEDGVSVVFEGPEGRVEERAGYLVGCDGPKSLIRSRGGFATTGWESTRGMYMADVTNIQVRPRPTGEYVPGGHMILATPLGDGYYRILIHDGSLPANPDTATMTFKDVADAWERMTGDSIHHGETRWMAAFDNSAALVTEYRRGRVLLAGDSAHETPPLAGWGLATGIQDAVNLGWKLAAVTTGAAPEALLDSYHDERHPLGEQLMRNTHAATMLYLSGEEMEPVRKVLRELVTDKDAATHFAGMVSGLGIRYEVGAGEHPELGRRLSPDREIDLADGTRTRVGELLRAGRGLLITTDGEAGPAEAAAAWADRVEVVTGTWVPAPDTVALSIPFGSVLVRPDGYIAWATPGGGDPAEALDRWFGPARAGVSA